MSGNHKLAPKRRVVIIDDDPTFAELLTVFVGSVGHDAVVKADSRQAIPMKSGTTTSFSWIC